jgi:hypothetical protein
MKKKKDELKQLNHEMHDKAARTNKKTMAVFVILRALIIVTMIISILQRDAFNVMMCIAALLLFTIPAFLRETLKIELPGLMEGIIYCFIYAAAIMGEIQNFYNVIPFWDTMLHTMNGFICAGIGFSLVDLLNKHSHRLSLSPIYLAIVSFCFSMTVGVCWEFIERGMDLVFLTDGQKDAKITQISSVDLNPSGKNVPVVLKNITETDIHYDNGSKVYVYEGGYLDIGLDDTMSDLFVNMIGAVVFSTFGYFYVVNRGKKRSIATKFIPTKVTTQEENEKA